MALAETLLNLASMRDDAYSTGVPHFATDREVWVSCPPNGINRCVAEAKAELNVLELYGWKRGETLAMFLRRVVDRYPLDSEVLTGEQVIKGRDRA